MNAPDAPPGAGTASGRAHALPLRLLLRFADPVFEQRFVRHYVAYYFRFAQASLVLGLVLVIGDYLVDLVVHHGGGANLLRLTLAVPVLLAGLGYSLQPRWRRHWQPVMAGFIVTAALCLFLMLVRLDAEGGAGLTSWVGVLNFTFLQFYCFVVLGVQFRHALVSGLLILAAFEYALWQHAGLPAPEAAYGTYHVLTVFVLAAGIGWWREYVLRREFMARAALDDSRAAAELRAQLLAHYDEITGLPNRRLFGELAVAALERARRTGNGCAVLHAQIDRFGSVTDVYGRGQGDAVLNVVAQRVRTTIRGGDLAAVGTAGDESGVVARLGDNAFSVLVTDLDSQQRASAVAQRLQAVIGQAIEVDGAPPAQPLLLSASVGIAMFPGDAQDVAGLMRCAELAARAARAAGGAQHAFFDAELNARSRARALLEAELRQALEAGQFVLHYQPKVDVRSGRIVGAEALVRWQHPGRGLVEPGRFIPLAEEIGLILALTEQVLQAACSSLRRWADAGRRPLPLSVNLPASSLADRRLPGRLGELMRAHGLPPSSLVLELTETMLMHDVDAAIEVLGELKARGFGLSLDDFGTGYSSLSHLKRLPMSELKIDRAFVTDVAQGGPDAALAVAIITLGKELGLQVVAEGVETPAQSAFLKARGCTLQQGYLFSRPLPREDFERLLDEGCGPRVAHASAA
ncbi:MULTISPECIES: bifunctional diguanylate cyclase/phosphodiesterase [unclassified Rubrivivax]|uniref:putative bifunctional diguanylate cyclase/phosphodiesterase n=1 Tax=unclassified Rubrivivax TaxID=2649762 RepID=UPI001E653D55|nr:MULTISPECIES: bifunctional diguanylate cyclase/phosphodiesterase [unclassified Rubrivivax]MCC9597287.1 bifunctional diguanylate cyclase/phosphodiesterase [Rubrivivax sp. JA1055]MCC9646455.1 bifunctional diguanylate cyclase/phosphodiesterase [Rubrivivax sp. JA1029]